jgi:hypothetical protein
MSLHYICSYNKFVNYTTFIITYLTEKNVKLLGTWSKMQQAILLLLNFSFKIFMTHCSDFYNGSSSSIWKLNI